jgi:hypothetical protein
MIYRGTTMKWLFISLCITVLLTDSHAGDPYQATGIKICEVDQTSAIIWTRLTKNSKRVDKSHPMPDILYKNPETGELEPKKTGVREYSCGPASDGHAGGWFKGKRLPEHRYLNVIGGFLEGTVDRENETPVLTFRHFGVNGNLLNEDRLIAQP